MTAAIVCLHIALILPSHVFARQEKGDTNHRTVPLDYLIIHRRNQCASFAAFMSSGDFFEGLRASEVASTRKFYRGDKEVSYFPDTITVEIRSALSDCSHLLVTPAANSVAQDFMSTVTVKAIWITGLKERPAEIASLALSPPKDSEVPWVSGSDMPVWTFTLTIVSKGVPLTDHLGLEFYSKDGSPLGQMSGRLWEHTSIPSAQ